MISNNMRIGGLASGMDIDTIVEDLMKAERIPLTKMQQDRTWLTWQQEAYKEMNLMLFDFRKQLVDMKLTSSYRSRTTSTTDENLVTATATSAASETSYTISDVTQLATAASKVNTGSVFSDPAAIDTGTKLYDLESSFASGITWSSGSVESENITVSAANDTFTLDLATGAKIMNPTSEMSVKVNGESYEIVTNIGDLADGKVYVDQNTGELQFNQALNKNDVIEVNYVADQEVETFDLSADTSTFQLSKESIVDSSVSITVDGTTTYTTNASGEVLDGSSNVVGSIDYTTGEITFDTPIASGSSVEISYKQNYTSFKIGSHTADGYKEEVFNVQASYTFDTVMNMVNDSDAGVSMFYDEQTGQMTLTRTETGNFNGDDPNDAGYAQDASHQEIITTGNFINTSLNFNGANETGGQNAEFTINGLATERSSNTFEVSGVTFTLKQEFTGQNVTVNVSNDTEAVFENIKSFVEKYNELIEKMNDKVSEERYRDYKPLTDQQKEEMSDKEIELWEEKAKSGLLRSDSILNRALNDMRRDFYTQVENGELFDQLAAIGITTSSNYREGGKLEIDEAKLKAAIQEDPQAVEKLFTDQGTTYANKGIVHRLYDTVNETMDRLNEKAGNPFNPSMESFLGERLEDLEERIDAFEDRLIDIENRYWNQFTAMEKAIQRMNQQSMYLMQQFGGGM